MELCNTLLTRRARIFDVVGFLEKDMRLLGGRVEGPSKIGTHNESFEIVEKYSVRTIAVCLEDRRASCRLRHC